MNMNDNERALLAENESLRLEFAGLERENARLREALGYCEEYHSDSEIARTALDQETP